MYQFTRNHNSRKHKNKLKTKYNTEYSATCRQYIPCADARGHSRFEQRKIGPCLSQSLACPCCRCETSGRHHSWWSAPDTERLWSHMHKLSSPRRWEERVNTKKRTGRQEKVVSARCCKYSSFHSLTTNLLLTFSKISFSLSAMDSPFLFFILFFSSFLQAYIFPVALTWQAHTWEEY